MPIVGSELKMYRSALVGDTAAANGGVLSFAEVVSNVNNNIMPDVPQAERVTGSTKLRKVFFKNTNAADLPLLNPRFFLDKYTQGDDAVFFHAGTQSDLQSALTGSEKLFGAGKLDANVAAGSSTITVLIETPSVQFFADGDTVRVSNKADVTATGQEEFATISGAPTISGSVVTLHLSSPLTNAYTAADTRVSNVYSTGSDLKPTISGTNVTAVGSGAVSFAAMSVGNVGSLYDQWTLTFTSSTAFTVSGARAGSVGSGNTLADFMPVNPNTGTAYFTLPAAAFSGVWSAGDTVSFTTNPAAVPLWVKRIVPAGANAISGNRFTIAMDGETA